MAAAATVKVVPRFNPNFPVATTNVPRPETSAVRLFGWLVGVPVSSSVGWLFQDTEGWPGALAVKFMRMPYSVELGAFEFGKVCGDPGGTVDQCIVLIGWNCASSAGVSPSITQGLHDVTVWPTCGPFTNEPGSVSYTHLT